MVATELLSPPVQDTGMEDAELGAVGTWCRPAHQPGEGSPRSLLLWKQPRGQASLAKQPVSRPVTGTQGTPGPSRG